MKVLILFVVLTYGRGEPDTLHVGVAPYPPYVFLDSLNHLRGFDIELLNYIGTQLGKKVKFHIYTFQELFNAIQSDSIDLVAGCIYITDERKEMMHFSIPYIKTGLVLVKRVNESINSLNDLSRRRIGVKKKATGEKWALKHSRALGFIVFPYNTLDEAYKDLKAGVIDVVIDDKLHAVYIISTSGMGELEIVEHPSYLERFDVGFGVNKEEVDLLSDINSLLSTFVGSSSYETIYRRWFLIPSEFYRQKKLLLGTFLAGITILLVFFIIAFMVQSTIKDKAIRTSIAVSRATARAIEIGNKSQPGHGDRVAVYAEVIARRLNAFSTELKIAALLHDLGKIALPPVVTHRHETTDPVEQGIYKQHPVIGYLILKGIKPLEKIANWIRWHHERWDGKGYPDGLKEKEIPIESRIIAVANAFDILTTRGFRNLPPLSVEEAKIELLRGAGTVWDPQVVSVAVDMLDKVEIEYEDRQVYKIIERIQTRSAEEINKLQVIYEILNLIRETVSKEEILKKILTLLQGVFDPDAVYIILLPDEEGNLKVVAQAGIDDSSIVGMVIPKGKGVTRKAFLEKRAIIVRDTEVEPLFVPPGNINIRSELAVPMVLGNSVLGVLDVESPKRNAFRIEDVDFFQTVATAAAVAIKIAEAFQESHDAKPMIDNFSESKFPAIFRELLEKSRKENMPLSVAVIRSTEPEAIDWKLLPMDSVTVVDGNLYTVLMPGVNYEKAEEIVRQIANNCEKCVYGIASYPMDGETTNQLLAIAHYRLSFGGY